MKAYYVGLDVHKASICLAVLNAAGKSVMEGSVARIVIQVISLPQILSTHLDRAIHEA